MLVNVRYWHLPDVNRSRYEVWFQPKSRHANQDSACNSCQTRLFRAQRKFSVKRREIPTGVERRPVLRLGVVPYQVLLPLPRDGQE